MDRRVQRTLAILFSILITTAAFAPGVFAQSLNEKLGTDDAIEIQPGTPPGQPGNHGSNSSHKSQKSNGDQSSKSDRGSAPKTTQQRSLPGKSETQSDTRRRQTTSSTDQREATVKKNTKSSHSRNQPTNPSNKRDTGRSNALNQGLPTNAQADSRLPPGLFASATTSTDSNTSTQSAVISPDANATALEHRRAALTLLRNTDLNEGRGNGASAQRQRFIDELNNTFEHVLDEKRVTSAAVFHSDKKVVAPLSQRAPNVTTHLVAADAKQAHQAVTDANRARVVLNERNVTFDETAVSKEIQKAEHALRRADKRRERNGVSAISQYRIAWAHSQRALDYMDWAVKPNVTIETRDDMPHDGNVTHAVNGTVFDVRTYEIDTVTVSHEGQNRTVHLDTDTAPVTYGTFNVTVTLHEPVNEIPVRGTDPNDALAPHDDEAPPPVTGVDVLRLDSDGLPDLYEVHTVGTEPLNPNSNSSKTNRNESDNGIIDGVEDFDGDGARTYPEYLFGTNPISPDTDGDDLEDGFEIQTSGISPLAVDTDNDGTADPDENFDTDGLNNQQEQTAGTQPFTADTDSDGLNDDVELDQHGTDPRKPDTDGDGLLDGEELKLGVSPLKSDTDSDGIPDGNESFTTQTKNESAGVAVDVTGQGNAAKQVQVRNGTRSIFEGSSVTDAAASEMVDLRIDREFENATVSLQYDDSTVDDESSLGVYRYDSEAQTFAPVESTVDEQNDTVSAQTSEFATFVVLDAESWEAGYESEQVNESTAGHNKVEEDFEDSVGWGCENDCDTSGGSIVVGESSAISFDINPDDVSVPTAPSDDYHSPPTEKSTEEETVGVECRPDPDPNERCFDTTTRPSEPTTTTEQSTTTERPTTFSETPPPPKDTVAPPSWSEYTTTFDDDVESVTVTTYLRADANDSKRGAKLIISGESETTVPFSVDAGKSRGWTEVKRDLSHLAGETVSFRLKAGDESTIESSYLAVEITRDSDGDGLLNQVEREGIRTGWDGERRIKTDPYSADTDGDGLTDGEEIGRYTNRYGRTYYTLNSNPRKEDSDDDGIGDYEETTETRQIIFTENRQATIDFYEGLNENETDPMQYFTKLDVSSDPMESDTDGDGIDDRRELMLGTHPDDADTDRDGILDDDELKYGTDPTLFDAQPPTIQVKSAESSRVNYATQRLYEVQFSVEDPSRVSYVSVIKGGEARFEDHPRIRGTQYDTEFRTGVVENYFDGLIGTTVDVRARDSHDNQKTVTAYSRTNFAGYLGQELQTGTMYDIAVARQAGTYSGTAAGAGQSLRSIKEIIEDPVAFFTSLFKLIEILDDLGILEEFIKNAPERIKNQQELNNPYNEEVNPSYHKAFEKNWYGGYLVAFIVETVFGGQVGKVAKNSERLASFVDTVDRTGDLRRFARFYNGVKGKATAPARVVGYKVARGTVKTVDISASGTRRILSGAKTAGQQVRLSYHLRRMDAECPGYTTLSSGCASWVDDLDSSDKDAYQRTVSRVGSEDANRLLKNLDSRTAKKLFSTKADDIGVSTETMTDIRAKLLRSMDEGTMSQRQTREFLDDLEEVKGLDGNAYKHFAKDAAEQDVKRVRSAKFEVERAAYYRRNYLDSEIEIEPLGDEVDIKVGDQYIEQKASIGELNPSNFRENQLAEGQESFNDNMGEIGNNPTKLEIDLRDGLGGATKADIERKIKNYAYNRAIRNGNSNHIGKVEVMLPGGSSIKAVRKADGTFRIIE